MGSPLIEARSVSCQRPLGRSQSAHIQSVTLSVWPEEQVRLHGPPGSGRSLLLHLLSLLEAPDSGALWFDGLPVPTADALARGALRNRNFGFVFSAPYLIPDFSVAENVAMPLFKVAGLSPPQADEAVRHLLEEVGLSDELGALPAHEVDSATQFRIALARALALEPRVLVVEAPAHGLHPGRDPAFAEAVTRVLRRRQLTVLSEAEAVPGAVSGVREVWLDQGRLVAPNTAEPVV